jgi:hypothetical protein
VRKAVRGADDEEVEGVLRVEVGLVVDQVARGLRRAGDGLRWADLGCLGCLPRLGDTEGDRDVLPEALACRRGYEPRKVALDPLPREVVGDLDDELARDERNRVSVGEPGLVRGLVAGLSEPSS